MIHELNRIIRALEYPLGKHKWDGEEAEGTTASDVDGMCSAHVHGYMRIYMYIIIRTWVMIGYGQMREERDLRSPT